MARAGRFGTKGLAITFVSDETDAKVLNDVQDRFEVNIGELPQEIDITSYSKYCCLFYARTLRLAIYANFLQGTVCYFLFFASLRQHVFRISENCCHRWYLVVLFLALSKIFSYCFCNYLLSLFIVEQAR